MLKLKLKGKYLQGDEGKEGKETSEAAQGNRKRASSVERRTSSGDSDWQDKGVIFHKRTKTDEEKEKKKEQQQQQVVGYFKWCNHKGQQQ